MIRLGSIGFESVTLVRAPMVPDGLGNTVPDWDAASETPMFGIVTPGASVEYHGETDATLIRWTVLTAPDAGVVSTDRMRVRGGLYEVEGQPEAWASPAGGLNHLSVALVVVA